MLLPPHCGIQPSSKYSGDSITPHFLRKNLRHLFNLSIKIYRYFLQFIIVTVFLYIFFNSCKMLLITLMLKGAILSE